MGHDTEACITILLQKATKKRLVLAGCCVYVQHSGLQVQNQRDSIQELEYYDRFRLNRSGFVLLALEMFLEMVLA